MDVPRKRGLSALLSATQPPAQTVNSGVLAPAASTADIQLAAIRPNPAQPRTTFNAEALEELAASIRARGLIQPLVVRQLKPEEVSGEHRFELIAGERRWRAAQMAGLPAVPAVVKQGYDEREILLVSLVENLQRDDLNPLEEALAYERLASTFKLTHDQIAEGVGKSRVTVSNAIRILELPTSIQEALKSRKLTMGHAKLLLTIPDPRLQAQFAAKVQAEGLTVRDLERLVSTPQSAIPTLPAQARDKGTRNTRLTPPHLQDIERRLREHFGTKVLIEEGPRKGRLVIEFYSVDDFERIAKLMGLPS